MYTTVWKTRISYVYLLTNWTTKQLKQVEAVFLNCFSYRKYKLFTFETLGLYYQGKAGTDMLSLPLRPYQA